MENIDEGDFVEITCKNCSGNVRISCEEINYVKGQGTLIVCSVCGRIMHFPEKLIPDRWRSAIYGDEG